jgi:hypothetical protein
MADLTEHRPLLTRTNSYWSYNGVDMGDQYTDNPIELSCFEGLESTLTQFLRRVPHRCDELTSDEHNQHWTLVAEHYDDAYCNLVFETFFDADGSGGAFLSEKTFKPIRHAQPFIVFGTAGTLATLRRLGYRCFDSCIDNGYDTITNNTLRYQAARHAVEQLNAQDLHAWYISCREDIVHNQELFLSSKYPRLAALAEYLDTI